MKASDVGGVQQGCPARGDGFRPFFGEKGGNLGERERLSYLVCTDKDKDSAQGPAGCQVASAGASAHLCCYGVLSVGCGARRNKIQLTPRAARMCKGVNGVSLSV